MTKPDVDPVALFRVCDREFWSKRWVNGKSEDCGPSTVCGRFAGDAMANGCDREGCPFRAPGAAEPSQGGLTPRGR